MNVCDAAIAVAALSMTRLRSLSRQYSDQVICVDAKPPERR
jgi:hypothetical protein